MSKLGLFPPKNIITTKEDTQNDGEIGLFCFFLDLKYITAYFLPLRPLAGTERRHKWS